MTSDGPETGQRRLDFASGGWVLLLALLAAIAMAAYLLLPRMLSDAEATRLGDGTHPDSYGFDLSNFSLDRRFLVGSGMHREGLVPMLAPEIWTKDQAEAWNEEHRGKYLVGADMVVGVAVGGEARAYPLRVLNWHEVVNDTLGGRALAVTYNPLTAGAVVFERRTPFAHSGLLYASGLLFYDRQDTPGASTLWSQLLARGVAGPRAGERLEVLPASVCRWDVFLEEHPHATVIAPDPRLMQKYKRAPYASYFGSDVLRFPIPDIPPDDRPLKTPLLVLRTPDHAPRVLDLANTVAGAHEVTLTPDTAHLGGPLTVKLTVHHSPTGYILHDPPESLSTFHAFRFAWQSLHP